MANGGAPSRPPGAGPVPLGMSSPCWWAQKGGWGGGLSSLGAVMGEPWGRPAARSIPADGFMSCHVRVVPPPAAAARSPAAGRTRGCVQRVCTHACAPCLSPRSPRRGWVAHPEPAPPSPFPSPDCLSEYRKNKLCRWPPASQKHLMSRSAQAALRGCVNLEEFPAWELLLGGSWPPPSKLCPAGGTMHSLPSPGVHPALLQLLLHPSGDVSLLFTPLFKRFGEWGGCLTGNLPRSLCLRMVGSCWGQWRAGGLQPPAPKWRCEQGERARLRVELMVARVAATRCWCCRPQGCSEQGWQAGRSAQPFALGRSWHPDPSGVLIPGGTALPPCSALSFLIIFIIIIIFPPIGMVLVRRGGGGLQSCAPEGSPAGAGSGSSFTAGQRRSRGQHLFPGTPCRDSACGPLWQEGR